MAELAGRPATIRVRGSRAQIEAVKQTAEKAGLVLAHEQEDSETQVAQALAQISQHEGLAQLEGRLTFVERQLERLSARREASDYLVDSELAVMRARLEDTLRAFAGITQEHNDTLATVERRVATIASDADRKTRGLVEAVRVELTEQMAQVTRGTEAVQAMMVGERRAFEEDATRRANALAAAVSQGRQVLEARIRAAIAELEDRVDAAITAIEADHPGQEALLAVLEARMDEWISEPMETVEQLQADLAEAHGAAKAEVDGLRIELADGLAASEEKALGAALHLESIIHQVRRRLVGDEAEWTAVVSEAGEATASLRARAEDLLTRVMALEASGATERGSWSARVDNLEERLDTHETWARVSVTEVSELSLRFSAMESRLAAADAMRAHVEEQAGTIEYLKQRIAELEARQEQGVAQPVLEPLLEASAGVASPEPAMAAPTDAQDPAATAPGAAGDRELVPVAGASNGNGHLRPGWFMAPGPRVSPRVNGNGNGRTNGVRVLSGNGHAGGDGNGTGNGHVSGSGNGPVSGNGSEPGEAIVTGVFLAEATRPAAPPHIFWPAEDMEDNGEALDEALDGDPQPGDGLPGGFPD